jgi:tRNA (guanine6-N2)-methyltransferase
MSKHRAVPELPPCYAMVHPGLESIAAEEIEQELGGEIKRTGPGLVVFRLGQIDSSVLRLRTTEDVFLYAWGTDSLTYRAADLESIRRWTAREVDWGQLLRIHHAIRPKPKGRPAYHLVCQLSGEHGYRRKDALEAMARGLAGKFPASWRCTAENASVEVWLTIHSATAICGLRLSDRTMRHRTYKVEHLRASLRPTLAAAMVRLADVRPGQVVLDPMCGAGTILAESLAALGTSRHPSTLCGGDIDRQAVRMAGSNLRRLGRPLLCRWDATCLPLPDASVDRIISNPPFGKQLGRPEEIGPLYRRMVFAYDRVLKPTGRAVLLVSEFAPLREAAITTGWKAEHQLRVRLLGQPAVVSLWRRTERSTSIVCGSPRGLHEPESSSRVRG